MSTKHAFQACLFIFRYVSCNDNIKLWLLFLLFRKWNVSSEKCYQNNLPYLLLLGNNVATELMLHVHLWWYQSINQSILFLIKHYIINVLSAVQWNTHISLNTYIYIYIYSEIQHTYKHSYKAAISAQIQCFYFRHTHSHTRGRCERPASSLSLVIHL